MNTNEDTRIAPQLNVLSGVKNNHELQDMPPHAVRVFDGELFNVYQWHQEMFDGSTKVFEKLSRADGVMIVAVTTDSRILIQHEEQPARAPFISLPGGSLHSPDEDPVYAAMRELREESGYVAEHASVWFSIQVYGKVSSYDHIYIMRGCKKVGEPLLDSGEKIRVEEVDFDIFCDVVLRDDFRTKTVSLKVATMLAQGKKEELRALLLG